MSTSRPLLEQNFIKELLSKKAKAMYTIVDKISGEVLGHALMVTEDSVIPDHLMLQPLQAHDETHGDHHPKQPVGEKVSGWSGDLAPATLASDLDISEDSSVNITEEDGDGVPKGLNDVKREKLESSDVPSLEVMTKNIGSDISPSDEEDDDIQIISEIFKNPSPLVSVASGSGLSFGSSEIKTCSAEKDGECDVNDNTTSLFIEGRKEHNADENRPSESKASKEAPSEAKSVSYPGKFIPGMPGNLSVFYTDVGVTQPEVPRYKGHRLVRCLLCKEEKIIAVSNFGDHLRGAHEQPVQCNICGKEFSGQTVRKHKKICQAIKDRVEGHPIVNKSRSKKKVKTGKKIRFNLISNVDPEKSVEILLKKDSKINKAKKKFGKRYNVSSKTLKLVHYGVELTGDELACQVEGGEIIVHEGFQARNC